MFIAYAMCHVNEKAWQHEPQAEVDKQPALHHACAQLVQSVAGPTPVEQTMTGAQRPALQYAAHLLLAVKGRPVTVQHATAAAAATANMPP